MDTRKLLGALTLTPMLAAASPTTYPLDPARCDVVAITRPAGLGAGLSHPHVIEARQLSGHIVYDPDAPEASSVVVSAPAEGLVNDVREARARHRLSGELSESDRKSIGEKMRAADQLDTKRYPLLAFSSTQVRKLEGGRLEVTGKLSIRGVSREVKFPVQVSLNGDALRGEGSLTLKHADFGFKPISLLFGAIANAEEIELRIQLAGTRSAPEAAPPSP